MSAIVIQDKVEIYVLGELPIQLAEKFQKLLVPMSRVTLTNHFAIQNVECRK